MKRRSLKQVLARQWIGFALALSCLLGAFSLLALYILEDHFLDEKLRRVADGIASLARLPTLPAEFSAYPASALPEDIAARLAGKSSGATAEFWRSDGRYVHALRARTPAGEPYALVYDVTEELTVNQALARYWAYVLGLAGLFALSAYVLARAFVTRLSRGVGGLVEQVRASEAPAALHAYAEAEPIAEFAELARRNAEAWEGKLDALARERETLAFLAHELRTPLQSARASLALLEEQGADAPAWARLTRAVARLERASQSVFWLSGEPAVAMAEPLALVSLLAELVTEFRPLAERKGSLLVLEGTEAPTWALPPAVAETLLANLLLNAVQHGAPGTIRLALSAEGVSLWNPVEPDGSAGGTGLGLQIVARLAEKFGLAVQVLDGGPGRFGVRIAAAS